MSLTALPRPPAGADDPVVLRAVVERIRGCMQRLKHVLDDEIRGYPTPIPRCDAQFNFLRQQRIRLSQDLLQASTAAANDTAPAALLNVLQRFIDAASYTEDPEEHALRARARDALRRHGARSGPASPGNA
jgi:hypothetical protein